MQRIVKLYRSGVLVFRRQMYMFGPWFPFDLLWNFTRSCFSVLFGDSHAEHVNIFAKEGEETVAIERPFGPSEHGGMDMANQNIGTGKRAWFSVPETFVFQCSG